MSMNVVKVRLRSDLAKYRKKPVVVEATQWFPGVEILGVSEDGKIETLEGVMTASPGDWVITGVSQEKYPCKPDIFAKTYDPV